MQLRVPAGFASNAVVQGLAGTLTAVAGLITSTDPREIQALLQAGFAVEPSLADRGGVALVALTGVNPSATLNTYGTAQTIAPKAGFANMLPLSFDVVFGGTFGSETVTVQFTMTLDDGTTVTTTYTATGTGTTALTNAQLRALFGTRTNNIGIAGISIASKSSLGAGSSIATVAINGHYANF